MLKDYTPKSKIPTDLFGHKLKMSIDNSFSSPSSTKSWIIGGLAADALAVPAYFLSRRSGKFRSRVIGIIPARFASSRFQGKPLVDILGKPMIQVLFFFFFSFFLLYISKWVLFLQGPAFFSTVLAIYLRLLDYRCLAWLLISVSVGLDTSVLNRFVL